jgi:putative membrane protein
MMGYGAGLGFGLGGMLWVLGCILLIVGLVALVAWAVSRATAHDRGPAAPHEGTEALDILRARFARGEISEAEYTQAANVLRSAR